MSSFVGFVCQEYDCTKTKRLDQMKRAARTNGRTTEGLHAVEEKDAGSNSCTSLCVNHYENNVE